MTRAAIGIRAHSGWGAVVAIAGAPTSPEVVRRSRIAIADPASAGARQPYHFAQALALQEAEQYLAASMASTERLAFAALEEMAAELRRRETVIAGCAILLASGRTLPALAAILQSHSLIHTAEGEFFRNAFWKASQRLKIPVAGYRERDLEQRAKDIFGTAAEQVDGTIANLGKTVGPPWTADQKKASLAALLLMEEQERRNRGHHA
jgi:hypothetical protein